MDLNRPALLLLLCLSPFRVQADPTSAHLASSIAGSARVDQGDTLEAVLATAGIAADNRAEAAMAVAGVYDVADLRPGDRIGWTTRPFDPSHLSSLSLQVSDGVEISLTFSTEVSAERREPRLDTVSRNEVLELDATLYDTLVAHDAPERFAVDLAALLAGQVDFRRDLQGGETFAIAWQEDRLPDGSIAGEPRLDYARLQLADRTLELLPTSAAGPVLVFEDGQIVQRSAPPILGARLSSVFGRRDHPVLGGVRMHTGIDYAAPIGTAVNATGAGRVAFAGTIRGYGSTVDIDHGGGVVTRYAHLSEIADGVRPGGRVRDGDPVGAVGATGLVSGPNLHYEVRLGGEPVDPMDGEVLPEDLAATGDDIAALVRWRAATGVSEPLAEQEV